MKSEEFGVVTFESTHHAIKTEGILKENEIPFKTIPTPREITLSCGLSIRFSLDDMEMVKALVENNTLAIKGVYKFKKDGTNTLAEKIL